MAIEGNPKTCVVLSGRSLIGKSLVSKLLKSETWIVRIADSAPSLYLDLKETNNSILSQAISSDRASYFQVDVRDKSQLITAIEGSSVVFHLEATDLSSSDFYLQYLITVQGTRNVINVCRECKVKSLIYNSSADVVFDGIHDIQNGDESLQYPRKFEDMLSDLKAQAETLVLLSSGDSGLLTCALRPSNAFGPDDTHLVPLLLSGANSGLAKFIIGNGENMCDFTYVDNIAHASICAEKALRSTNTSAAGKAFFITNLEPMKFWEFASMILEGLGYQSPSIHLPARLFSFFLRLANYVQGKLGYHFNAHSLLNPAIVQLHSRTRTFNCSKAQTHIGYSPVVSLEEGVTLTVESFSYLAEDSPYTRYCNNSEPSKVDKLLGSGTVAEILLWRDEKKTFNYCLAMLMLYNWFLLSERTFISSTAKLLLLISVILFGHGILPSSLCWNRFGFTIQQLSPSHFEVSVISMNYILASLASSWNRLMQTLKSFAQTGDCNIFFKAAISLYLAKILLSLSFSTVIGVGLVFAFTAFFTYEQYEEEVNRVTKVSLNGVKKLTRSLIKSLPVSVTSFLHSLPSVGSG
ncbi:hypothetical protein GIB67_035506 [Kingdonia uniflora]|uniref:Reticulon-like protein n=1 Tax=Kingdonia uniflora TaxID=39325 RepID=A0A7J7MCH0_9MAGN|nr:hypothetical protein GIB67_035506 [Kingdonia uniflora]